MKFFLYFGNYFRFMFYEFTIVSEVSEVVLLYVDLLSWLPKRRIRGIVTGRKTKCVFAEVLADLDNGFAAGLEMLALKRSSNKETFEIIKKCFDTHDDKQEDGKKSKQIDLDTSVEKLRIKYRNLKQEWRKVHDRIKKATGKGAKKEPIDYVRNGYWVAG